MGQALSSEPQHVNLPQHDAMSTRQHVAISTQQHVQQHVSFPQHAHQLAPKHATQLAKTTVPVVGTVSRGIDPEQTELEEDSIPRPATYTLYKLYNVYNCVQLYT